MAKFQGKRVSYKWKVVLKRAVNEGVHFILNSGQRTMAEQAALVREKGVYNAVTNPAGAAIPSPTAPHIRVGHPNHALDIDTTDGGETRLQNWVESKGVDWVNTVSTEAWHGEVSEAGLNRLYKYTRAAYKREKAERKAARAKARKEAARKRRQERARKRREAALKRRAKGIDVSNHQGNVDFVKVRKAGYKFVWVMATEGQDWLSPTFHKQVRDAKAAGMKVGAYHYMHPKVRAGGPEAEVADFIKALKSEGLGKGDLRPVLDVETTALSQADTAKYVVAAVKELRKAGYDPIIYTFPLFMHWPSQFSSDFPKVDLWIANPGVSKPTLPAPWKLHVAWQHSFTGKVDGVSGDVDLNVAPVFGRIIA